MGDRELTPRQRALVDTLVATGCTITEAARVAGYSGGSGSSGSVGARVTTSRTLRLPHVAEYLRRQMQDAFRLEAPWALATLRRLHTMGTSEYVQYHAASTLLDRAGYGQLDRPSQDSPMLVHIVIGSKTYQMDGKDPKSAQILPPPEASTDTPPELAHAARVNHNTHENLTVEQSMEL
jgi:hypothetical protein